MLPESLPVLRAAFEATGSGHWIMRTVSDRGLDRAHGFRLDLALGDDRLRGGRQATEARLASGEVDVIDTDWLALARCRRAGLAMAAAAPYGAIFGGLVAPRGGPLTSLADLPGRRIGVIHADDKNWLLLRAACRRQLGRDPAECCARIDAGSKTRLQQLLADGEVDGALLFWHQIPAATASGAWVEVCDLLDLLPLLGSPVCPSTFFVFREPLLTERPGLVRGFTQAVAAAIAALRLDGAAWRRAANADPASAAALRRKWLARIGLPWQPALTAELARLACDLTGQALPDGTFAIDFLQGEPV